MEDYVIECSPEDGCQRCNEARVLVAALKNPSPSSATAEEILANHIDKESMDELSVNVWPDMLEAMTEFAALQRKPQSTAEGAEAVIESRIKHFNSNHHTYEGKELRAALDTIRRLVPPENFATQQQPPAEGAVKPYAYMCPVCCGNGLVPNGFYNTVTGIGSTTSITPETCRSCNGTGVVFFTLHAQKIADKMVSERLREELISLSVWLLPLQGKAGGIIEATIVIDEYLKSRER